ncbi:MAG: MFS transporter [Muribaculaceae bacterium]|nr:MFS transporter [Muribaculaceae bacterium]
MGNTQYMSDLPLRPVHYWILTVSSMEQIIGAALSTIVGIMIPMIVLVHHPEMGSVMQGIVGASGLVGIALGAAVIGPISDREGYLGWFRMCPVVIIIGSAIVYFMPNNIGLISGLFIAGFGVGGGYSLDSAYISELMPDKWKLFMVGVAKGTSALGFLLPAVLCYFILKKDPSPAIWNSFAWIIGGLGVVTLLMRIRWRQSPHWLMIKGKNQEAEEAAEFFFGKDVMIEKTAAATPSKPVANVKMSELFKGENLKKVIFTGIPWACEGMGVYGVGVFLPVLIMALGLAPAHEHGIGSVTNSIELTAIVNFFILPGFALGLWVVNRMSHTKMLAGGFFVCSVGLLMLLAAYLLKLPAWISIVGFVIFEVFLNAGPHLVTFILPSQVYPVEIRGTGSGIASMLGKVGAVIGVLVMPMLLKWGGITLVLIVTFLVHVIGGLITIIYGKELTNQKNN